MLIQENLQAVTSECHPPKMDPEKFSSRSMVVCFLIVPFMMLYGVTMVYYRNLKRTHGI